MHAIEQLCRAIRSRTLLEFDYDGHHRVVAPYCHGVTRKRAQVLRAIQVGGTSRSGGFGFGKLWHVEKIENLRNTDEPFLPTDPGYNPDDSALAEIHCRV
ncbi:MAG TPA: hypothetical protein VFF06_31325 [Polyangia bacterium]|nr:hypothetical protein [Polyangia bacterium]